jgi:hypothetical protein
MIVYKFFLIQAIKTNQFYKAFWPVMGKSMMFIVKKTRHEPNFLNPSFELIRVSSSEAVLKYFYDKGVHIAASKVQVVIVGYVYMCLVDRLLNLCYLICVFGIY